MKNKILNIFYITLFVLFTVKASSSEQFNFDITEIQILDNGNKFIGKKKGTVTTDSGIIINADEFEYIKNLNILKAKGNVKINDTVNEYLIYTKKLFYEKDKEKITTEQGSKAVSLKDSITIEAEKFEYDKLLNILIAKEKVSIIDEVKDYKIFSEFIKYIKNEEKIFTEGETSAEIHSKYNFKSENVVFFKNLMQLTSNKETTITDKSNLYNLSRFKFFIEKEELRGEKIIINSNYLLPKNDKFYFENAIINLKNQDFVAKDTKIKMHKNIFDNTNNDPRLMGVSSKKKGPLTTINKGIFTSCKENDNCPPWSIEATEIKHDKNKKQIDYKNALLRVYNVPVLYFPKFFHPDPTVERQSGILRPVLNSSNVLGSSFSVPYYHVIADESDLTITPTIFNNSTKMIQNEYRKLGKNYQFKANFGHTRNYNNSLLNEKNNISYLFSKLDLNLDLKSFNTSKMTMKIEKVTNDTFLKVFDNNLFEHSTSLKPSNKNNLSSELKLFLDNEEHSLAVGIQAFEDLQLKNSDRYQYILPYYNYNKSIFKNYNIGSINFNSNGNNNLENTNQLKSRIINNISYSSFDFFSENGVKNNFNLNLKNLNSVGKNVSEYKSSPQIEFSSIFEFNSSIPLIKKEKEYSKSITPKLSIRVNPSDMKNYNDSERSINTQNIFSVNRLGINDSFESGKSLTVGIDYKKELLDDINKYFTVELATVLRDKEENFIPKKTSLNQKSSNLFGSISNNLSENININYNFAIDNNFDELVYNDINATLSLTNFKSTFNFVKETGIMGDQNFLKNTTSYKFNDENYLKFNTRRNRKLNLTEFYDLVYEYKNDCLTAGIKYKKTYYEDRDLKPSEDLLFTITLFPLTTYEQKIDQ